ncbi:MAG: HEPN domain-containing protein [Armatimonadetes bacterium]|nr:HEPN domain-containing protein [Armatimonadota bacterium]
MRPDSRSEARRWLEQALNDLRDAKGAAELLSSHALACYLSQQAAEKALKGLLLAHGAEPWGHSVKMLLEEAASLEEVPAEVERAAILDAYYIPTRYPNGLPGGVADDVYGAQDSAETIALAEAVVGFVSQAMEALDGEDEQ